MKLSIEELKNKPHLLALITDEDLVALGIDPKSIRPSTTSISKDGVISVLSEKALRELKGLEKAQHITFANWLRQEEHHYIHAPTYRKVHDLPPGWPDFTVFRNPFRLDFATAFFIEFKSPISGFLSEEQQQFRKSFYVHICYAAIDAINLAREFFRSR